MKSIQAEKAYAQLLKVLSTLKQQNPLMDDEQLLASTDWIVDAMICYLMEKLDVPNNDDTFETMLQSIRIGVSFGTAVKMLDIDSEYFEERMPKYPSERVLAYVYDDEEDMGDDE